MSVSGELGDFDVASVLQILAARQASGRLRLAVGGDEIAVFLVKGRLAAVASERLPLRLGRVLRAWGIVTDAQLQTALRTQADEGGRRPLGEILVARGWVTAEQVASCVHEQAVAALSRALAAKSGTFAWLPGERPPHRESTASLDPRAVLLDAVRRIDELRRLRSLVPPRDAPLAVSAWVDPAVDVANHVEQQILGLLRAGVGSWGELAEVLPIDEASMLRAVASLQRRRIVLTQATHEETRNGSGRRETGMLSESDLAVLVGRDS